MITFTAQAESVHDLKFQLQSALADLNGHDVPVKTAPAAANVLATGKEVKEMIEANPGMGMHDAKAAVETKKRTRRTKEQIEADNAAKAATSNGTKAHTEDVFATKQHDAKAEEAPAPAAASVGAPVVNKEAVHNALQQVNVSVGLPKAREILAAFKVNRISEIKETDFKAFIDKCNEAVMSS